MHMTHCLLLRSIGEQIFAICANSGWTLASVLDLLLFCLHILSIRSGPIYADTVPDKLRNKPWALGVRGIAIASF